MPDRKGMEAQEVPAGGQWGSTTDQLYSFLCLCDMVCPFVDQQRVECV
jgi:hypothetical protein